MLLGLQKFFATSQRDCGSRTDFSRRSIMLLPLVLFVAVLSIQAGWGMRYAATPSEVLSQPVTLTAPNLVVNPPATFDIFFSASDIQGDGVLAFQFNVEYDPNIIDPSGSNFGCSTTGIAAGMSATCNVTSDPGNPNYSLLRVSVSGVNPIDCGGGVCSGPVLKWHVTTDNVNSHLGDISPLNLQSVQFFSGQTGAMTTNAVNGQVQLLGTQTITPNPAAPASAVYGSSFNVAATGGGSGNPVVITTSGGCSGGGNNNASITMTSGTTACNVFYNQAGNAQYQAAPQVSSSTTAQKANATISVVGFNGPYDAQPHGVVSSSATGVGGADLSSGLGVGSQTFTNVPGGSVPWTFSGGTNYNDASGNASVVITKVNATCNIVGYSGVYDAGAHGASGSCTGVGGVDLSSGVNYGATFTNVPGGTAHWTFTGAPNYNDQANDVSITITKATATISVVGFSGPYDAQAHGVASSSATGVNNADLSSGLSIDPVTFANVPGGSVPWTFNGGTNYNNDSGNAAVTITAVNATCNIIGYTGVYDAAPHGASGNCTGVGGANLNSGINYGATFTDVPGGTANWSFASAPNYNPQGNSVAIVINKATATISVVGFNGPYDGQAHGVVSSSATGVGGADLSSGLSVGTQTFTNVPGGSVPWTFTGGTNYNDDSGNASVTITKVNATCNIVGYSGVYDAAVHGASGSCTGVGGANLNSGINYGATFTNVPGGTAHWTFTGAPNYNDQANDVSITITKASATISVVGFNGPYDAQPHGVVSSSATGVGGADLSSGLSVGTQTFTNVPGGSVPWTFAGGTNYNDDSGNASVTITKVNATCNIIGYSGVYDGNAHGATGTCTGVGGVDLSSSINYGSTFTDVPGGTAHWTFTGAPNYNDQANDASITITKASQTINVTTAAPASAVRGTSFNVAATGGASGNAVTIAGAGACSGSGNNSASITMNAGTGLCTVSYDQAGNSNYEAAAEVTSTTNVVDFATVQFTSAAGMEDESQTAQFLLSRTGDLSGTTTVTFATVAGGTATAGGSCTGNTDYITTSGQTVTFNPGDTTATGAVQICGDLTVDPGETIRLQISNPGPSPAQLGTTVQATLTINDTATQFRSTTPVTAGASSSGAPYPSTINVSGVSVNGGMRVTLYDVQFDTPANLDVMLVGPGGQKFVLVADAGGSTSSSGTLTFSDSAGQVVPQTGGFVTGLYEPTSWETPVLSFAPPAPAMPYAEPGHTVGGTPSFSSVFGSGSANGTWNLYIRDDGGQPFTAALGTIAGGWGVQFFQPTAASVAIGGRVLGIDMAPIRNATVVLQADTGEVLTARSNAFGYYYLEGVASGRNYMITSIARGRHFPTRLLFVVDSLQDEDIVADQ